MIEDSPRVTASVAKLPQRRTARWGLGMVSPVSAVGWTNTTHNWRALVDEPHLRAIREQPETFAPGGVRHLLHEVLAYVADEVDAGNGTDTRCQVTLLSDGMLRVRDYGRGTDTRRNSFGRVIRKPVMATKDLRFFDTPSAQVLPDGHPRRGMSVVAALSDALVHENRRLDGAWHQRYVQGLPVEELIELEPDGTTGTVVQFLPMTGLAAVQDGDHERLQSQWPMLELTFGTEEPGKAASGTGSPLRIPKVPRT